MHFIQKIKYRKKVNMEKYMKIEYSSKSIKNLMIILIIIFATPSIIYIITNNNISNLNSDYNFVYTLTKSPIFNGIMFLCIFGLICLLYIIILKNYKKIFNNNKEIIKFIIIISALFTLILPMISTDVFYYISTGWSEAKYKVNPYYTSVSELIENEHIYDDEILNNVPKTWSNQKIVYGPAWPLICKLLTLLSFGKLSIALLIFKLFNLCLHILNCILIKKISNKNLFILIYALNPLVLFEGLSNVHNDMLLIFLIFLALYLAIKKKNIVLSVITLAIATAVKYVAILLVPFIVIYYFRKEKVLKRILYAIGLCLIFLLTLIGIYLLYTKDLQILQGIFIQQGKYSKSLLLSIYLIGNPNISDKLSIIFTILFALFYIIEVIMQLFNKNVTLRNSLRIGYTMILTFLLLVITNFQVWYIMWLMPLLIFQNKKGIKSIINLTISSELACTIFFVLGESYTYGHYFWGTMIILWLIFNKIHYIKSIEFNII